MEEKKTISRIIWANDTAANWASVNPILTEGEHALEIDTRKYKIGDGINRYSSLPYGNPQISQELGNSLILSVSQKILTQRFKNLDEYSFAFKDQEKLI